MTEQVDVVIVGAGPSGLTLANILGLQGVRTVIVEERDTLIDYPRGVGLDDEALRTFQSIGLVDRVLPHTVPNQILRFFDAKRRLLAEMAPPDARFGWPKRNGFVQPMVDAELHGGLDRFDHVEVRWAHRMENCVETEDGVTLEFADGKEPVRARYVVGCDGGRSATRRLMGVSFDGTTSSTRWLVVDVANDPLGHPNSEVGADPKRPYVSISIAHGIRRFEFLIHDDESDELADDPEFVRRMLAQRVPHPERVDMIRHRVYTHHSRIAGSFRKGRLMLAGDAAHLMPVWQGQGYNSGIRDAANLGWKLAAVVTGQAGDALLDTYDIERRKHARAMIDLSTMVGRVISPTNRRVAALRDRVIHGASLVPTLKRYVLEMRFKPMPRYQQGAVFHAENSSGNSPTGDTVHPTSRRYTRRPECPARRRSRRRFRGVVLEQQPTRRPRRGGVQPLESVGGQFRRGTSHDPAPLARSRRRRRDRRRRPDRRAEIVVRRLYRLRAVRASRPLHRRRVHRATRTRTECIAFRHPLSDPGRRLEFSWRHWPCVACRTVRC